MKYRVKEEYVDRFYGRLASTEYIDGCQENGVPQEDIDFMVREYGEEIYDMLEEI